MKYAIDRITSDICVLENIYTGEVIEVKKGVLPDNVTEKVIVEFTNGKYLIDETTFEDRKKTISEKLERNSTF